MISVAGDEGEGVQLAGLGSVGGEAFSGLQLAGLFAVAGERLEGAQVSGLFGVAGESAKGLQVSGLFSVAGNDLDGIQLAGLFNVAGEDSRALQVAGLMNVTGGTCRGLQVGLFNIAGKLRGVQIGLVNVSEEIEGAPVGLVNLTRKEDRRIQLAAWAGSLSLVNAGVKIRAKRFYSLLYAGAVNLPQGIESCFAYGFQYGYAFPLRAAGGGSAQKRIDVDAGYLYLDNSTVFRHQEGTPDRHVLSVRGGLAIELSPQVSLVGGAGLGYRIDYGASFSERLPLSARLRRRRTVLRRHQDSNSNASAYGTGIRSSLAAWLLTPRMRSSNPLFLVFRFRCCWDRWNRSSRAFQPASSSPNAM